MRTLPPFFGFGHKSGPIFQRMRDIQQFAFFPWLADQLQAQGQALPVKTAGLPGIAVPAGLDKQGLPLGLQLIGRPWEEGDLLNIAYSLEGSAGFVAKPSKWW